MVCTNALEDLAGGGVIVDMGGQVAVLQELEPAGLVRNQAVCIGLPHDGFGAVDLRVALVQQIFPRRFPGQLCAELEALEDTITDDAVWSSIICV